MWAVKEGYRRIIVVGGDGTLHETVNGLFIQQEVDPREVLLAVIAVGTGNDWCARSAFRAATARRCAPSASAVRSSRTWAWSPYEEARTTARAATHGQRIGAGFDAAVNRRFTHPAAQRGRRSA